MVSIQPGLEGSMFFLQPLNDLCIMNGCIDLQAIADDPSVLQ